MLIEFTVSNFRSILTPQTLSLVADSKKDLLNNNTFPCPPNNKTRLLRSVVIYGANASGKSNLMKAISFMKNFVLKGSYESRDNQQIDIEPFVFRKDKDELPSMFEIIFMLEGVRYQYGFTVTNDRVNEEWLYAFPKNKPQRWFTREFIKENKKEEWYINPRITGPKKSWKDSTRKDALFLSTASQLNSEQLSPVFKWFRDVNIIEHGSIISPQFTIGRCNESDNNKSIITTLMRIADNSINDLQFKKMDITDLPSLDEMPNDLKEQIINEFKERERLRVELKHSPSEKHKDREAAYIKFDDESDGTKKLFSYLAPWIDTILEGEVLIVDELENSFHSQLLIFLLKLFNNKKLNKNNGQLIFATHDTVLMQKKNLLRRDQIWFIEKDSSLESRLYPLTSYHPRNEEAIQSRYLQGCYGAIPHTEDFKFRFMSDDEKTKN